MKDRFIQTLDTDSAIRQCQFNYNKYGSDNTITTTGVPFITIGRFGIYEVRVRYYRLFNQKPCWGYLLDSGGGMQSGGGFETIHEALVACVKAAKKECKRLDIEINQATEQEIHRNLSAVTIEQ